jgi:hypothetical protein
VGGGVSGFLEEDGGVSEAKNLSVRMGAMSEEAAECGCGE